MTELTAVDPTLAIPFRIPVGEVRLELSQRDPPKENLHFLGSSWRGAFGAALRETHCLTGQETCDHCPISRQCLLPELFDNQIPANNGDKAAGDILRHYRNAPQPYALRAPHPQQQTGLMELHLFGHHADAIDHCAQALVTATNTFLHAPRYQIHNIASGQQELSPEQAPPAPSGLIRIQLLSPLQLRAQSRLITPKTLRFVTWFTALLRRASLLQRYYTDTPLNADFKALKGLAQTIQIQNPRLTRFQSQRWSNRKHKAMPLTGLLGRFDIDLHNAPELWPLIWAGQQLQTGRLTTMGFGSYRIESASLPNSHKASDLRDKGPDINGESLS